MSPVALVVPVIVAIVAVAVALWEAHEARYWKGRADHWYDRCMAAHNAHLETLRKDREFLDSLFPGARRVR